MLRMFIILAALAFTSISLAGERSILFLQQETPGHIIYVSLNEKGKRAIVSVVGMGASRIKEQETIPIKDFDEIWSLANSKSISKFLLPEGTEGNMADPQYYTVNIRGDNGSKINVQVPVSEKQGVAGEFVKKLKRFIPVKS